MLISDTRARSTAGIAPTIGHAGQYCHSSAGGAGLCAHPGVNCTLTADKVLLAARNPRQGRHSPSRPSAWSSHARHWPNPITGTAIDIALFPECCTHPANLQQDVVCSVRICCVLPARSDEPAAYAGKCADFFSLLVAELSPFFEPFDRGDS